MTDLERLASWLRCPVCGADLSPIDRLVLGCPSGHRHDVNKRGYISLLGGLAMALSPAAVGRASRSSDRIDGLVADTWRPLPIRDAACDAVLDIFAPRNLPEFARVLRPGGSLVVVVPRGAHLSSLRAATSMLDVPADKADDVIASAEPLYALLTREHVSEPLPVDDAIRNALIGMGPSAHHVDAETGAGGQELPTETRLDVDVLHFTVRAGVRSL